MNRNHDYSVELNQFDRDTLEDASIALRYGDTTPPGILRYEFYRRKGHATADALAYALVWCRNAAEQKSRRLGHDTGAVGWL